MCAVLTMYQALLEALFMYLTSEPNEGHIIDAAAAAKSLQSCPTLQPQRQQPTRLPIPGILQARTLEWVAISFSSA